VSKLGLLLAEQGEALFGSWTESLRDGAVEGSVSELHGHVPGLLQELSVALRAGKVPNVSASATEHAVRTQESGFDVEAVVREYRLLTDAILGSAEAAGLELTMPEVRIVTEFVAKAVAQGVAAHRRHEEQLTLRAKEQLESLVTEMRVQSELIEVERDLATAVAALEAKSRHASEESRAQTEFLLSVAGALSESLDLDVVLQRLVDVIAPAHTAFASVWSASADGSLRRRVHAPFNALLADSQSVGTVTNHHAIALPVERVFATGQALRLDDHATWMSAEDAAAIERSISALDLGPVLLLPIRREKAVVAVISMARRKGGHFSEADVALFESAARLAGLAFENARLYSEMVRLRVAAEDATAAKDRFLAHVSHDLRNPLNSILGWSALLRGMKNDPVQFLRGIDVIERNAKAQVQLIEDLLDVSRITAGKLALEIAVEDVKAAIDAGLDAARLAASAKNVTIVVSVDDDIGAITVDPDRFRQILWNLVSNAVKFTPSGGTVRVIAQRLASTFRLVVADDGRGIAAEFLPRVFAAFEQSEAGAQRAGGLGLGLAIVRHLVELHGGSVQVESDGPGTGARFTVELPIRAAVRPSDPIAVTRLLEGARVLVVDDEEDAREVVMAILKNAGASVTPAASADEALASVLRAVPHVMVSDIGMPTKDGKSLMRDVRDLPDTQGGLLPAIALTALVRAKDRVEILSAGFNAHVAKPIEPTELVLMIAGLLGRRLPETHVIKET
jgi:signal transduction histidine kinase